MTTTSSNAPAAGSPPFGARLLPTVIDDYAKNEPDRVFVQVPIGDEAKDGWRPFTFKEYSDSINHMSHWLVEKLGTPLTGSFPTIAYIGPNDVRYLVLVVAAIKTGFKVLLPSPRNSVEAQVSLSKNTDCQCLLYAEESKPFVTEWLATYPMRTLIIEPLSEIYASKDEDPFPYNKTYEEAKNDLFAVLHTSGSTGIPKPIVWNNEFMALSDRYQTMPTWEGHTFFIERLRQLSKTMLMPMPLFHATGLIFSIAIAVLWGHPMALNLGTKPVTADNVVEILKYCPADAAGLPPSVVAEMSKTEEGLATLKKLSFVFWGGGSIPKAAGDKLAAEGVVFVNGIGSTEYGIYPLYWQDDTTNWEYFIFNNEQFGCEYRHLDADLYEQVMVRDEKKRDWQGVFITFPDAKEFRAGDMYSPHPTLPNHWRHRGRSDDVIVFSNGEKLNPVTIEKTVGLHPKLRSALVVGAGKFQAAMFLDPVERPDTEEKTKELIDSVWPLVKKVNAETVKHGRIAKHLIALSDENKPFTYSGKGELQKGSVLKRYGAEIDAIYEKTGAEDTAVIETASEESLMASIRSVFEDNLGVTSLDETADFTAAGIDSLQIITSARIVSNGLEAAGISKDLAEVSPRTIYQKSTLQKLAKYIFRCIRDGRQAADAAELDNSDTLTALLEKYTQHFPTASATQTDANTDGQTVLLTGSTGSLGSYLLQYLEQSSSVSKIICLNRATDGGKGRQPDVSAIRGLATTYPKTEFIQADLAEEFFGIGEQKYTELLKTADRFIHNAWPVNFNMTVESFEPVIKGVRSLADFAIKADKKVSIVFLSSIGTVDAWPNAEPIPEKQLLDFRYASLGYGQSKLLSSLILDKAAEASGIRAANIRVGQIAGPSGEKGQWNKQEWLPSIIASSVKIGKLPQQIGGLNAVDWMPIEDVANAVIDITACASTTSSGAEEAHVGYFNLTNPNVTQWQELTAGIKAFYEKQEKPLQLVGMYDWVVAVEEAGEDSNPAFKLLDTYKALLPKPEDTESKHPGYSTQRSQTVSQTVREMGVITQELLIHWCKQWSF